MTLTSAQQSRISALGQAYNSAQARGDTAGMNAAHNEANSIRSSGGMVAGKDYNASTGASMSQPSSPSRSSGSPSSGSSSTPSYGSPTRTGNNTFQGTQAAPGYAYTDQYGFSHVVDDQKTAQQYGQPGSIQTYTGSFGGGYALGSNGQRMAVATPGAVAYGNDARDGITTQWAPSSSLGGYINALSNAAPSTTSNNLSFTPTALNQGSVFVKNNAFSGTNGQVQQVQSQPTTKVASAPVYAASALSTPTSNNAVSGNTAQAQSNQALSNPVQYHFNMDTATPDQLMTELGRTQVAWNQYHDAKDTARANDAASYGQTLRNQLKALGQDIGPGGDYRNSYTSIYGNTPAANPYVQSSVQNPTYQTMQNALAQQPAQPEQPVQPTNPMMPNQGYQFTPDALWNMENSFGQDKLRQAQSTADQQKQSLTTNYGQLMAALKDQRALENNMFDRQNNPYSGGTQYREAMLERQRQIGDANSDANLQNQLSSIDQNLANTQQAMPDQVMQQYLSALNQEFTKNLQTEQFGLQKDNQNFNQNLQNRQQTYNEMNTNRNYNQNVTQQQFQDAMTKFEQTGKVTSDVAPILGLPVGTTTLQAQQMNFNQGLQAGQMTGQYNGQQTLEAQRLALQQQNQNFDQNVKKWQATGVASGIPGVPDGTAWDAVNVKKANATNGILAGIMANTNRDDAITDLKNNAAKMATEGVSPADILKMINTLFPSTTLSTKDPEQIKKDAAALAQKDPSYITDPDGTLKKYMDYLNPNQPPQ